MIRPVLLGVLLAATVLALGSRVQASPILDTTGHAKPSGGSGQDNSNAGGNNTPPGLADITPAPEPASIVLFGTGVVLGLAKMRRLRR
jgi:hypothetical protein